MLVTKRLYEKYIFVFNNANTCSVLFCCLLRLNNTFEHYFITFFWFLDRKKLKNRVQRVSWGTIKTNINTNHSAYCAVCTHKIINKKRCSHVCASLLLCSSVFIFRLDHYPRLRLQIVVSVMNLSFNSKFQKNDLFLSSKLEL